MSAAPAAPLPASLPAARPVARPVRRDADHDLAEVVHLDRHRPRAVTPRSVYWRRRIVVLAGIALVAMMAVAGVQRVVAAADRPAPAVVGTAVLEPGDTLWDLAVEHTPTGGDVRTTLRDIQTINGFDSGIVAPWTVVLLPAVD